VTKTVEVYPHPSWAPPWFYDDFILDSPVDVPLDQTIKLCYSLHEWEKLLLAQQYLIDLGCISLWSKTFIHSDENIMGCYVFIADTTMRTAFELLFS